MEKVGKCELCGALRHYTDADEAEMVAEYESRFGAVQPFADLATVCDRCDRKIMKWLREEHQGLTFDEPS